MENWCSLAHLGAGAVGVQGRGRACQAGGLLAQQLHGSLAATVAQQCDHASRGQLQRSCALRAPHGVIGAKGFGVARCSVGLIG